MEHTSFKEWINRRKAAGMPEYEIAQLLGCAPNSITRWKRFDPPAYIGLAVAAIESGLQPWKND